MLRSNKRRSLIAGVLAASVLGFSVLESQLAFAASLPSGVLPRVSITAPRVVARLGAGDLPTATVRGPLSVHGNRIFDSAGKAIALRGVNSTWFDVHSKGLWDGSPLADISIAGMKLWGANIVRVELNEAFWNSGECAFNAGYASQIDRVVQSVTSRGMVALIDLHVVTRTPCAQSGLWALPGAGAVTFWKEVAARYKSNPLVAFDLFNEPHDVTAATWLNGGTVTSGGITYQAVGMQKLADTVRSTGASNLIFASGANWALNAPQAWIKGSNIVYAAHAYTCPQYGPPACSSKEPFNPAPRDGSGLSSWNFVASVAPVVVTEFGWPGFSLDGAFMRNVIAWAEDNAQGWIAFDWTAQPAVPSVNAGFSLLTDPLTMLPNASGLAVQQGFRNPGVTH